LVTNWDVAKPYAYPKANDRKPFRWTGIVHENGVVTLLQSCVTVAMENGCDNPLKFEGKVAGSPWNGKLTEAMSEVLKANAELPPGRRMWLFGKAAAELGGPSQEILTIADVVSAELDVVAIGLVKSLSNDGGALERTLKERQDGGELALTLVWEAGGCEPYRGGGLPNGWMLVVYGL